MKSLIVIALTAAACGKGSDPAPTPVSPPGLTVVDPGLAPRVELRYRAPKGTTTGLAVTARIDLTGLLRPGTGQADVLNGIAYDAATDRLFLTGKLWPRVFEVRLRRK